MKTDAVIQKLDDELRASYEQLCKSLAAKLSASAPSRAYVEEATRLRARIDSLHAERGAQIVERALQAQRALT